MVAENGTSIGLPGEFGQSTLVIDDEYEPPDSGIEPDEPVWSGFKLQGP